MSAIVNLEAGYYRVPLPSVLTDSTHGEMRAFELCTVRIRDADGAEGVGYTFTVGRNGGGLNEILVPEMPELLGGEDAALIERLWQKLWGGLRFWGGGGAAAPAVSARPPARLGA